MRDKLLMMLKGILRPMRRSKLSSAILKMKCQMKRCLSQVPSTWRLLPAARSPHAKMTALELLHHCHLAHLFLEVGQQLLVSPPALSQRLEDQLLLPVGHSHT